MLICRRNRYVEISLSKRAEGQVYPRILRKETDVSYNFFVLMVFFCHLRYFDLLIGFFSVSFESIILYLVSGKPHQP